MLQLHNGALRLFRVFGIDVYLHWTWVVVAYFMIKSRTGDYQNPAWAAAEYVSLFAIVLMHEFGHALACRSVGGEANRIILWPLGGIAYVQPPPRPGALLWSIAAGPFVNLILVPITVGLAIYTHALPVPGTDKPPDVSQYFFMLAVINAVLLVFNMLPIYPLDGGQIVQALLWFMIGPARSLLVVSVIGLSVGGAALIAAVVFVPDVWSIVLAGFIVLRSWVGFKAARTMSAHLNAPRRRDLACPNCHQSPPAGPFWICDACRTRFDTFAEEHVCPGCEKIHPRTMCPACRKMFPGVEWHEAMEDEVPEAREVFD
jgi:Zn-dependent protease